MGDNLLHHLTQVLPNSRLLGPDTVNVLFSNLNNETKAQTILSKYFQKQIEKHTLAYSLESDLLTQAREINILFPSIEFRYILDQLKIYADLPNRSTIVLRQLVYLKEGNSNSCEKTQAVKREFPTLQSLDNLNNNQPLQKVRKLSCTITKPPDFTTQEKPETYVGSSVLESDPVIFENVYISPPYEKIEVSELNQRIESNDTAMQPVTSSNVEENVALLEENSNNFAFLDFMSTFELPSLNTQSSTITTSSKDLEDFRPDLIPTERVSSFDNEVPMNSESTTERGSLDSDKTEIADSDKTEIYALDNLPVNEPLQQNYSVSMVNPITINMKSNWMDVVSSNFQDVDTSMNTENSMPLSLNEPSTSKAIPTTISTDCNVGSGAAIKTQAPSSAKNNYNGTKKTRINCATSNMETTVLVDSDSDVEEHRSKLKLSENNATGTSSTAVEALMTLEEVDMRLVNSLCNIFSEACPKYIKQLCRGKRMSDTVVDGLINVILDADGQYPKRPKPAPEPEKMPENHLETLKEVLPDADPDYLSMMCDKFDGKPDLMRSFINEALEKKNYPTKKEYLRRQQLSAQQKQYTTNFNVETFVKVIPNPGTFFSDPSRKIVLSPSDCHYALVFMRNKFNKLPLRTIQSTFTKLKQNVTATMKELEKNSTVSLKTTRKRINMPANIENIPLLQELAYYSHKDEIHAYLEEQKKEENKERFEAKNQGLLKCCSCCYDEEVLPRDIYRCENGCEFCKECVVKSSEVHFGEGKLEFPCLMNCSAAFSLQTLQMALSPKLFSKVAQKKALEEIKAAGIEELEMCPFCDFATIIPEGYNIFTCMNPECMKESCRMCKEPSHIPLRCDEIEKDEDVKARVFVENKMTEALLRKCWKCGIKFFKEEGCNKMTCSCGAQMCYVCGQQVTSYQHFNGNGGDRYDLCPLYSDTNVLNKQNVLKGAEEAKAEIGNVNLKHDPTADVNKHFQERRKMFPQDHLLVGQIPAPELPRFALPPPHNFIAEQLFLRRNIPRPPFGVGRHHRR